MSDLVDFLLARIAEDEADVRDGRVGIISLTLAARVLAECDSKRRIVEHAAQVHRFGDAVARQIVDNVLSLLALPYVAHPDYDEDWRP